MLFLVDTDWVIHFLNGRSDVVARIRELSARGVAISRVSLAEVYEGIFYSRDPVADEAGLEEFLRGVTVLGIDDEITRIFGRERGRLRKLHKTIGDFDLLIGATALRHDLTLLSNNRRHFERIENLRIISV